MRTLLCALAAVVALCACDGEAAMSPKSGGRPYEVLIVSAGAGGGGQLLADALSEDAPGLPQAEPLFDVSLTDSLRFNQAARLARNIVIVTVSPDRFTRTRIRYEKNVWARPQTVVYVNTPDTAALGRRLNQVGRHVADLLTRSEMNVEIARLADGGNAEASAAVDSMFGWRMRIPADMTSSKRGEDFLWLSDNAAGGMQSICVYSYPGLSLDPERALAVRDSVMKANIPGERPGMYVRTARPTVSFALAKEGGRTVMKGRGLWEMQGDAMGGPFVSHWIVDSAAGRIIAAEAFVYAPETKKRNLVRQTEAVLYTLEKAKPGNGKRTAAPK